MNRSLIFNISPKPDGTIADQEVKVLKEFGTWLTVNGNAICGTHPWTQFAEGSTSAGAHTSSDFCFTVQGKNLYAIMMGSPSGGATATIQSLGKKSLSGRTVTAVNLLGFGKVNSSQKTDGLKITLPKQSELADPNTRTHSKSTAQSRNGIQPPGNPENGMALTSFKNELKRKAKVAAAVIELGTPAKSKTLRSQFSDHTCQSQCTTGGSTYRHPRFGTCWFRQGSARFQ